MTIKKFKIFTWDRILIYLGACFAFPLASFAQAVRYNYFSHHNGLPVGAWVAMIGALLGFALGDYRLFWDRYVFKKAITGYSDYGTGIIMPSWPTTIPPFSQIVTDVDAATKFAIDFWQTYYPNTADTMEAYIGNISLLGFTATPIDLLAHAPGVELIIPPGFSRFAVGATQGNAMGVEWQVGEDWTSKVVPRFSHEISHTCLNAINVDPDTQDQLMLDKNYGF